MVYFINNDGTVGSASTEADDSNIKVVTDLGYKNIVSILSGTFSDGNNGANSPIFVDIDGNLYSENLK